VAKMPTQKPFNLTRLQTGNLLILMRACLYKSRWLFATSFVAAAAFACAIPAYSQTEADENPFGLPAAHDGNHPGSVVLHGGGWRGLREDFRQEFVRLAGGREARIVLVPSDECQLGKDANGKPLVNGETIEEYKRRLAAPNQYGRWVALRAAGQVADFHFLYRDKISDPNDRQFYDLLEKATGVWLPASDQEWLPKEFAGEYPKKTSRFQLALREVVARGGVVGGLGGGAASLPETVITSGDVGESGWMRAKLGFGLALFSGAIVDQNFDSHAGRLERLTDLLRNGSRLNRLAGVPGVERRTIGLGVERDTVVILRGNTIRAMGEGRGHIFLKSNGDRTITWRTLEAAEEPLVLKSSARMPRRTMEREAEQHASSYNPFGMPPANDPSHPGAVVLHGGGSTGEMIDLLPKLTNSPKPRLVHCPAARESCRPTTAVHCAALNQHLEDIFAPWRQLQIERRLDFLSFITTNTASDANREEFVRPLTHADALWFCGGDQKPLADLFVDRFKPTRFQMEAWNIIRRGGVVGGSSAGLAVMPDIMIEGGESANGKPAEATLSRGLGVMKHVLAEQHFDTRSGRIERMTRLLRNHKRLANFSPTCEPKKMIGLAVEEDTALVARANRVQIIGRRLAHVFLQSNDSRAITWHALKSGDAAILEPGLDGPKLELEDWEFSNDPAN
jgi:cyanophycinase